MSEVIDVRVVDSAMEIGEADAAIRGAFGALVSGVSKNEDGIFVHWLTEPTMEQIAQCAHLLQGTVVNG